MDERSALRLTTAGYVLDGDTWQHPETKRMLAAVIAEMLTDDQLARWIADGDGYVP